MEPGDLSMVGRLYQLSFISSFYFISEGAKSLLLAPLRKALASSVFLHRPESGPGTLSYLLLGATQNPVSLSAPSHSKSGGSPGLLIQPKCHPNAPPPPFLVLKDKGASTLGLALALPRTRASGFLLIRTQANSLELVDTLEGKGTQETE